MKFANRAWSVLSITALTAAASAQCINIDVGCNPLTVPPASYGAAAGQWGVWNALPINPVATPLVNISGFATTATATAVLTNAVTCATTPFFLAATGDGGMFNDYANIPSVPPGQSTTWTINGLTPAGIYNLYVYSWSPVAPLADLAWVTMPGGGPLICGGWDGTGLSMNGGGYEASIAFADAFGALSFTVAPFGSSARACLNGVQLVQVGSGCQPEVYCAAGANSLNCVSHLVCEGTPSATAPDGFVVTGVGMMGHRPGVFYYGISGAAAKPFACGTLCVRPPIARIVGGSTSGATGTCGGSISFDWNKFIYTNTGELGDGWLAGDEVWMQGWFRDTQVCSSGTGALTDALHFVMAP